MPDFQWIGSFKWTYSLRKVCTLLIHMRFNVWSQLAIVFQLLAALTLATQRPGRPFHIVALRGQ